MPRSLSPSTSSPTQPEERNAMPRVSRGFRGRRADVDPARVPPGQYVTTDFPVLSAGPTPRTPLDEWSFTIAGPSRAELVVVGGVPGAAVADGDRRHPLRDEVVKARHHLERGRLRHAARRHRHRGDVHLRAGATAATRRTCRSRTSSTARPGSPTSSTASRLRRSMVARRGCCPASVLLEEREVDSRHRSASPRRARVLGALRLPQLRRPLEGAALLGGLRRPGVEGRSATTRRLRLSHG